MARKSNTVDEKIVTKEVDTEVEKESVVESKPIVENKPQKRTFSDHDYIMCHSVTPGGLHILCKSGNKYDFVEYGAELEMEYQDLVDLIRRRTSYIFLPRIIIDDADILNEFKQVKKVYEDMYTEGDLKDILHLPSNQLKDVIRQLPDGLVSNLRTLAATMVSNGEIDSLATVRVLKELFGADFDLLSELYSDN